jgi:HEPN domain-containing protein
MSHDPVKVQDTTSWFLKAKSDITAAECLIESKSLLSEQAAFQCQQATEKAIKGFLFWHGKSIAKTHDLKNLCKECIAIDAQLEPLLKLTTVLTQFAVDYRYPGQLPRPTEAEVRGYIKLSSDVVEALLSRLPFSI